MRIPYTRMVKGEDDPYQALASAIVIRAVKDYRNYAKMIRNLQNRLMYTTKPGDADRDFLLARINSYKSRQATTTRFFQSRLFAVLCDLDACVLVKQLEKEVS